MSAAERFTITQGSTWSRVIRWEAPPVVYKTISAITRSAPVSITCTGHGLVNGWRAAVASADGMTQINAKGSPPKIHDYHKATVVDADTITFNDVNSLDFDAYTGGGVLQYNTPVDLTGYTARMQIRKTLASTDVILDLNTTNARIVIDNAAKTVTLTISAADTELLTFNTGVYSLELVSSGGVVTTLLSGPITLEKEITR